MAWISTVGAKAALFTSALLTPQLLLAGGIDTNHHHPHQHLQFGTPNNQCPPTCCEDPCKPPNHVRYLRDNFPDFYDIVTQNSLISTANRNNTLWNGLVELSGLANFDVQYSDRSGGPDLSSLYGVGTRPLFSFNDVNVIGSINNIDLFVDAAINNWVVGHFDFAYVNGSRRVRTYEAKEADWGSVYRAAAGLHVNQAYLLFANPAVWPIYIQLGRINHPFGHYDAFPMTPSLTQLISEIRTGGVVLGTVFDNGLYGSVQWSMSETSLENFNGSEYGSIVGNNKDRNYGLKLGYRSCVSDQLLVHLNGAYIADIRDADYLLEGENYLNYALREGIPALQDAILRNTWAEMTRAAGVSLHGEMEYCGFGLSVNYVTALSNLNKDPLIKNSKINAWDVTGMAHFHTFGCPSYATLSYQESDHNDVYHVFQFDPTGGFLAPNSPVIVPLGHILPSHRIAAEYHLQILPSIHVGLQWVHDEDFSLKNNGTDRASNFGNIRLSAQF